MLVPLLRAFRVSRPTRLIALPLLLWGALSPAVSAQTETEESHWYGAVSGAWLPETRSDNSAVTLGSAPVSITTTGEFDTGDGRALSFVVGRHFYDDEEAARLEAELWSGRIEREGFRTGVFSTALDDSIDLDVLFLNAFYRLPFELGGGRIWIGGGFGYADLTMPNAARTPASCNCLAKAEGDGLAYQLRLEYERPVTANTSWSAGFVHLWFPDSNTNRTAAAYSDHGKLSAGGFRFAIRHRF